MAFFTRFLNYRQKQSCKLISTRLFEFPSCGKINLAHKLPVRRTPTSPLLVGKMPLRLQSLSLWSLKSLQLQPNAHIIIREHSLVYHIDKIVTNSYVSAFIWDCREEQLDNRAYYAPEPLRLYPSSPSSILETLTAFQRLPSHGVCSQLLFRGLKIPRDQS